MNAKGSAVLLDADPGTGRAGWDMLAQMGSALVDLDADHVSTVRLEKLGTADVGVVMCFWQVIPSTGPAAERALARIRRLGRAMDCSPRELNKVEVALREALNNAILHGNGGDPKKKIAVCCLCAQDQEMVLVVRDFGPGFDPGAVPDPTTGDRLYAPRGRGLHIMRKLMDEVRFEKGGRQVVMKKASLVNNGRYRPV